MATGYHLPGWWRSAQAPTPTPSHPAADIEERRLADLINDERVKAGCSALRIDGRLRTAAETRALSMNGTEAIAHVDSDLEDPQTRASAVGYPGQVVENQAVGLLTAEDVMARWLDPQIDPALKARLDNCAFVSAGIGFSDRQVTERYGPGVWVLDLGTS